jgi:hypothetical protein
MIAYIVHRPGLVGTGSSSREVAIGARPSLFTCQPRALRVVQCVTHKSVSTVGSAPSAALHHGIAVFAPPQCTAASASDVIQYRPYTLAMVLLDTTGLYDAAHVLSSRRVMVS